MKEVILSKIVKPPEVVEIVNRWFKKATIVMISRCSVNYSGRASSTAKESMRLIVLKQDGTVLVHESVGCDPLNWQPKSTVVARQHSESEVELQAIRANPKEELTIKISGSALVVVTKLGDVGLALYGKEEDIVEELAKIRR